MKCRRVHHKREDYDILICRPSKWGNPFSSKQNSLARYKVSSRSESISMYRDWILKGEGRYLLDDLPELKGKVLGCWCREDQSCHGDILVELVNQLEIGIKF
jgi:hypothetical protein